MNLTVTLYEIFGYLLPGTITLVALAVGFWVVFLPYCPLRPIPLDLQGWALFGVAAYILGHMVQAAANVIMDSTPFKRHAGYVLLQEGHRRALPPELIRSVRTAASRIVDDGYNLPARWLWRLCDEVVAQTGRCDDREMFVYREGFYRGTAIAMFFLALSLLVRFLIRPSFILIGESPPTYRLIPPTLFASLAVLCAIGGLLLYRRYLRFSEYKVSQAALGLLILANINRKGE